MRIAVTGGEATGRGTGKNHVARACHADAVAELADVAGSGGSAARGAGSDAIVGRTVGAGPVA